MGMSWGGMRKKLEQDYLCESLKGHVQYFVTKYRKTRDCKGRIAIRIDGREVFKSDEYEYWMQWWKIKRIIDSCIIQFDTENEQGSWNNVYHMAINNGGFDDLNFYEAFYIYDNQNISESLFHENYIVRLLAILDRRVGKRTLIKIADLVEEQPEWLQIFYLLRLKTENIDINDKVDRTAV